jgi:plasmid stabilization system protein ParE
MAVTLREARDADDLERFIAEREAEKQAPGDADKLGALTRRLSETPKSVKRTSKRAASAG